MFFTVNDWGIYNLTCEGISIQVEVSAWYVEYTAYLNLVKIVTWADGTWEEIVDMLTAHYEGKINIADYWAVGDSRTVHLNAMASSYVNESQVAQDVEFVILGFNHDDLADGSGKSAVTVQQKNCLLNKGYMNASTNSINYADWSASRRKQWIDNIYINALPSEIQSTIKTVNKQSSYATGTSIGAVALKNSQDRCFLVSNGEVFANTFYTYVPILDGEQYEYYKTVSNRIKYINNVACNYWLRTAFHANTYANFMRGMADGTQGTYNCNIQEGIAPAFCL